jgi:hypothetical protein
MGESAKSVLALILIVGAIATGVLWTDGQFGWLGDIATPVATLLSLVALIWAFLRRDKAPDLLRQITGGYFERTGLCFAIVPTVRDDQCELDVFFQNRYERPCKGVIVLQPSEGFFLTRRKIQSVTVEIECPGAGFGVVHVPWGVPKKYQGKSQSLDVVASVDYPERRGAMVRFRDGKNVGDAGINLWRGIATVAAAAGGMIVMHRPARMKLTLPRDIAEEIDDSAAIVTELLWEPGAVAPGRENSGKLNATVSENHITTI